MNLSEKNIISLANGHLPGWDIRSRKKELVFARALIAADLRKIGVTVESIADRFNVAHPSIINLLKRRIDRKYLSQWEEDILTLWENAKNLKRMEIDVDASPIFTLNRENEADIQMKLQFSKPLNLCIRYIPETNSIQIISAEQDHSPLNMKLNRQL